MDAIAIAVVGVVATGLADVWQQALRRAAGLPVANWRLIGRWVAWMPRGVFVHRPIAATSSVPGEGAVGWVFHYAVGLAYAALYLAIVRALGIGPTLTSAVAFGAATVVAPFFLMQPALGTGVMARRAPNRPAALFVTVTTHLVFGIGLYVGVIATALVGEGHATFGV